MFICTSSSTRALARVRVLLADIDSILSNIRGDYFNSCFVMTFEGERANLEIILTYLL